MSEQPTKLQRWLDLVAFLVGRRIPVPVEKIMEGVPGYALKWREGDETARATARRTFERDKEGLRRAGIPLRTMRYTIHHGMEEVEGYRLDQKDFYLPYVRLAGGQGRGPSPTAHATFEITPEEIDLALRALRRVAELPAFPYGAEASSALRKLTFDLERGTPRDAPVLYLERAGSSELRGALRELSEALLGRKRVRFRYHGLYRDEATEREVAPYALLFLQGQWYLVGHDSARDAVRVFRVGRIEELERNAAAPGTPDYQVPADFRLEEHIGRRPWEFVATPEGERSEGGPNPDEPIEVTVLFRFPLSRWAERAGHGSLVEQRADGAAVRVFEVRQVPPFVRWLLSMEDEAEVLEPAALGALVRTAAERVAAGHREPPRPSPTPERADD